MTTERQHSPGTQERRVNPGLRKLVDEMLAQVREAAGRDAWSAEERERAVADLDRIMASVRRQAIARPDEPGTS